MYGKTKHQPGAWDWTISIPEKTKNKNILLALFTYILTLAGTREEAPGLVTYAFKTCIRLSVFCRNMGDSLRRWVGLAGFCFKWRIWILGAYFLFLNDQIVFGAWKYPLEKDFEEKILTSEKMAKKTKIFDKIAKNWRFFANILAKVWFYWIFCDFFRKFDFLPLLRFLWFFFNFWRHFIKLFFPEGIFKHQKLSDHSKKEIRCPISISFI